MPKKRYLYENKKAYYNNKNQQEDDFNYFYSPKFSKIIAKKYGKNENAIEQYFKVYFNCLKEMQLTQNLNKDKVRNAINNFDFSFYGGLAERETLAETDLIENTINLRNSFRKSDLSILYHEFNHVLSGCSPKIENNFIIINSGYSEIKISLKEFYDQVGKVPKELLIKNYNTFYDEFSQYLSSSEDKYSLFNEGVTELLTMMQVSYKNKNSSVSYSYYNEVGNVKLLYKIIGNKLFEGYFCNDFNIIARVFDNKVSVEKIKNIADLFNDSNLDIEFFNSYDEYFVNKDFMIKNYMLDLLEIKINNDIEKIEFKNIDELKSVIYKAYLIMAANLQFGTSKNDMILFLDSRNKILERMVNSASKIINSYANSHNLKFKISDEEESNLYLSFDAINRNC